MHSNLSPQDGRFVIWATGKNLIVIRITYRVSYTPMIQRYRGGPRPRYVFRGMMGLFLRPPYVRDLVKEGYFFVPSAKHGGGRGGGENLLTMIHEIYDALTPSDSQSDWASEFATTATCCL